MSISWDFSHHGTPRRELSPVLLRRLILGGLVLFWAGLGIAIWAVA